MNYDICHLDEKEVTFIKELINGISQPTLNSHFDSVMNKLKTIEYVIDRNLPAYMEEKHHD